MNEWGFINLIQAKLCQEHPENGEINQMSIEPLIVVLDQVIVR